MKKNMVIFGVLSTVLLLVGTLLKGIHFPGGSICLCFGVLFIVFCFLPLFFYTMYKEHPETNNTLLSVIGYLTASCMLIGVLFRVQHWPWTHNIILTGQILLVAAFLPVYLVGVFRKTEKTNINFGYIILIVGIGLSSLFMASSVKISKDKMDEFSHINAINIEIGSYFIKSNDSILSNLQHPSNYANQKYNVEKLKIETKAIIQLIDQIEAEMLKRTGKANATVQDFDAKENDKICMEVMDNYNSMLNKSFMNYKTYMLSIAINKNQKYKLINYLAGNILIIKNESHYYKDIALVQAIEFLSNLQMNIAMAENEILTSLK